MTGNEPETIFLLQSILKIADSKIADFWLFSAIILKIDIFAPK